LGGMIDYPHCHRDLPTWHQKCWICPAVATRPPTPPTNYTARLGWPLPNEPYLHTQQRRIYMVRVRGSLRQQGRPLLTNNMSMVRYVRTWAAPSLRVASPQSTLIDYPLITGDHDVCRVHVVLEPIYQYQSNGMG
jgi:hypothetical protein